MQRWLNALPYNAEIGGETLRSFRGVVRTGKAHCLEAALSAATILEQHGYPPLVLSFESIDLLDHVIFVYRTSQGWGSVARSRDPGLHGRKPVFATPRALALSYQVPYVDFTGAIKAYAIATEQRSPALPDVPTTKEAGLPDYQVSADRKSTRLNSSHVALSRMPSSA